MNPKNATNARSTYTRPAGKNGERRKSGIVSLFSGAGGLDLGFVAAGLVPDICFELDSDAIVTLKQNHPDVAVVQQDINELAASDDIEATVRELSGFDGEQFLAVIGGPPCQSFSTAGHRLGLNDPRGKLVLSYLEIVNALRPRFCVFENVRGITSMHIDPQNEASTPLVDYIVSYLEEIGYKVSAGILNAADYGVPQKRERFVLLGCRAKKIPLPLPTHGKSGGLLVKPWVTLGDAIRKLEEVPAPCAKLTPQILSVMRRIPEGGNWRDLPLRDQKKHLGGAFLSGGGKVGFFRRLSYSEPAPTLVTSPTQKATLLCHPTLDRPLNIREYAAIQGFPGEYLFSGRLPSVYRQIGNAVPIGLAKAIGQQIKDAN